MTDDGDGARRGGLIFFTQESASERHVDAEHVEVVVADVFERGLLARLFVTEPAAARRG